eukprot:3539460-Rhodomonas_salina.1
MSSITALTSRRLPSDTTHTHSYYFYCCCDYYHSFSLSFSLCPVRCCGLSQPALLAPRLEDDWN